MSDSRGEIQTGLCTREAAIVYDTERGGPRLDKESRTIEVAFSSETPVSRIWGDEILDHDAASIDVSRVHDGRAPVLVNHDFDRQVGVVEGISIGSDRVGRARLRFGRSQAAEEVWQDVVDGIRSQVSVGYRVNRVRSEESEGDREVFRVIDWTPLEISLVAVAADGSVGVGRSEDGLTFRTRIEREEPEAKPAEAPRTEEKRMDTQTTTTTPEAAAVEALSPKTEQRAQVNESELRKQVAEKEQNRIREIMALATRWNASDKAQDFIAQGKTPGEFAVYLTEKVIPRGEPLFKPSTELGMSEKESGSFSFQRAIRAMLSGKWEGAELELEASRAVADKLNREPRGVFVPWDVQTRAVVTKAGISSATIATDLLAQSFIEYLYNNTLTRQLGITVLSGLVGDIAIPRRAGVADTYWVADDTAITEDASTDFDQVTLAPNTIGAFVPMSRKMLLQSTPAIEGLIRSDLATRLAIGIDLAVINGSGSNQPQGIFGATGVGDVSTAGANGGPLTWDLLVEFITDVATGNALMGSLWFLTNPLVMGHLMTTLKVSGDAGAGYLWHDVPALEGPGQGMLAGYRAAVSTQVPSTFAKGTASDLDGMIFGNFSDYVLGEWGTLDLMVDPYAHASKGGLIVRAFQDVDGDVRHGASFAICNDINV